MATLKHFIYKMFGAPNVIKYIFTFYPKIYWPTKCVQSNNHVYLEITYIVHALQEKHKKRNVQKEIETASSSVNENYITELIWQVIHINC